ncbi:MAG TPA: alanine racemase [Thermoanaerobaculia bacterium]|nr:alanine racemase [Thermoanaerobaculia bacterium]
MVDLDALAANYRTLARRLPDGCAPMPVVKADAYGHGAAECARRLVAEGAPALAVAVVEEAVELRRAGIGGEILVMGYLGADQLPELVRHALVANVHSVANVGELAAFGRGRGVRLPVHLKLDTGMTRLGIPPRELADAAAALADAKDALDVAGVFQNFASADDETSEQTPQQVRTFAEMLSALRARGVDPPVVHAANSAATLAPPGWPAELPRPTRVRPGLALYTRFAGLALEDQLLDVMAFVSVVEQVKRISPGTRVGYGGAFVAARESVIALVPAGYADGVPRSLASGGGQVLVHGARCPIAGRISMDMTAVDVTDLPGVPALGAEVVFFGTRGGTRLGVEECARAAGTVSWEILCGVGPRVPRVIVESGVPNRVISRFLPGGDGSSE